MIADAVRGVGGRRGRRGGRNGAAARQGAGPAGATALGPPRPADRSAAQHPPARRRGDSVWQFAPVAYTRSGAGECTKNDFLDILTYDGLRKKQIT